MFGKKCLKCGNKIKGDYEFCPFCGKNLKSEYDKDDYGFLGKNDYIETNLPYLKDPLFEKIFNNAMSFLERQMRSLQKELIKDAKFPKDRNNLNIQFFVDGKRVFPDRIEVESSPVKINNRSVQEKLRKYSQLPKKEPESRLRRLAGRIIYELEVPGVKSIDDILINQLENSIEIKALSDKEIYLKNINVKLPVMRYSLRNGILILEFQTLGN